MGEITYHTVSTARGFGAIGRGRGFRNWIADRKLNVPERLVWPRGKGPAASVAVKLEAGSEGRMICSELGEFRKDSVLWIGNAAFVSAGFNHQWLEVRVPVGRTLESSYWQRLTANDIAGDSRYNGVSADLAPALASGTLYRWTRELKPEAAICQLTLEVNEPASADINACLNPLILGFDNLTESRLSADFEVFRESRHLLDIQPHFAPHDLPRARLLAELHRRRVEAGAINPQAPAVPRLLFGEHANVGALPFLLLDSFKGRFLLEGLSSGAATWSWSPAEGDLGFDKQWLADYCLGQLDVTATTAPDTSEALAGNEAEKQMRRDNDHMQWSAIDDLGAALLAAHVPGSVAQIALREPDQIRDCLSRNISGGRLYTFAFREDLGPLLLPESEIRVRFPDPPAPWVGEPTIEHWRQTVARYQFDVKETPLAAADWWLRLLDDPTPVQDAPSVEWSVGNGWHWPFYASLFRRQISYQVYWVRPSEQQGLGQRRFTLGHLVLGAATTAANQDLFHGPDRFQLLAQGAPE